MASEVIRARMREAFGDAVYFAEPALSGDNAVGAAVLASRLYGKDEKREHHLFRNPTEQRDQRNCSTRYPATAACWCRARSPTIKRIPPAIIT